MFLERYFDKFEHYWEDDGTRKYFAIVLVGIFLLALLVIEFNRQGWLPGAVSPAVPTNHFFAVDIVFTFVLIIEIIGLVFGLARSVSNAVGIQIEILSLILLRASFKELTNFNEPIQWGDVSEPVLHMLSDAFGALVIFVILGYYYQLQKHRPITKSRQMQHRFVVAKKGLSLVLLVSFVAIGCYDVLLWLGHQKTFDFFSTFYTILIFADILIVLISTRYSANYYVLFRNSGFAFTTVMIRLALTAPPYINALLGVGAAVFAVGLTLAYNHLAPKDQHIDQ